MSEEKRRFPRTDRPGSGIYRGEPSPGVAFDDYRAADEHKIHRRRERSGLWRSLRDFLKFGPFPLESDRLLRRARSALARDPTLELDHVHVSAADGIVCLSGSVPTRWMKERISDCLLGMGGVSSIRNDLEVRPKRYKLPQEGELSA